MSDKPTARTLPMPLGIRTDKRAVSDRLPIPFARPLGVRPAADYIVPERPDNDIPVPVEPYKPPTGYVRVSQCWGIAQHPQQAIGTQGAHNSISLPVGNERMGILVEPLDISRCFSVSGVGLNQLYTCHALTSDAAVLLGAYTDTSNSAAAGLDVCALIHTGDSEPLKNGLNAFYYAGQNSGRLKTCAHSVNTFQAALAGCKAGGNSMQTPIVNCHSPRILPALDVPCEWYEIPIEETPLPPTWVCGLRPQFNRAPLNFHRRRVEHSSRYLPLPFACHILQHTPIREGYIMINNITADFDDGQPLSLLSASFTSDTGGYCWQGSVTLPPDDFVRLNIDGRPKGSPALINCRINGDNFVFMAEDYSDNRQFGQKSYTVTGRSQTALLGDDYAAKGDGTYRSPIYAAQIANEQLKFGSVKLDGWGIADWLIPADVYSVSDKAPMAVLQELAAAAGGFVESDRALPVVRLKPKWPKAAWEVSAAEPDVSVPSSVIIKISGQRSVSEKANGVFVWANHDKGVGGDIYRSGSDREPRASALSGALYTDQAVLTAAGIAALSATGIHKKESVTLPVSDKYAIPLAELGQIWQIQEPSGMWQGVVVGVTLDVSVTDDAPVVTQTLSIDRYLDD